MIKKEMPARQYALHKKSKEFIKKKDADKDKNKNKSKFNKDSQFTSTYSNFESRHSKYFDGNCHYCHKKGHKAEDCCKHLYDLKNKDSKKNNEESESKN